jgi:hypothetical protein
MNERIKELWDQAALLESDPSWEGQTKFMDKFAELLIVKCANIIWHEADMKDSAEINEGGYKILEHFGIDWTVK